ncbi:MAG TPA: ImmA/IrrE family metallo-endopeptidase [Pirellulales bacterium]|jgi:hypothetical protein|nr:ImmA/IrrE family metallo-endopeptidase [Pirellulales bacterium]
MAGRSTKPGRTPRFMQPQEFEDEAALILAEYGRKKAPVTVPPIPIDEIVEEHFEIAVEIRDLRREYPEGDVLGAIYFNDKLIAVDQSLVPDDFPAMRSRYRFTLAHELAHWRLHRHLYLRQAGQKTIAAINSTRPDHVLRSRQYDPKEVQANRLAACLLMPREMLKRGWHEQFGGMEPLYLDDLCRNASVAIGEMDEALFEDACRPLATMFEVSPESMRYRLVEMKLLQTKREPLLF